MSRSRPEKLAVFTGAAGPVVRVVHDTWIVRPPGLEFMNREALFSQPARCGAT